MKVEDCIFFNIAKVNQAAMKFWTRRIASLNVTAVQGMILNFLYEEDRLSSRCLGERTVLDSATLTGVLDRLEVMRLITRNPHPTDGRSILISLTEKGKNTAVRINKAMREANREFMKVFSPEEEKSFRSFLNHVRNR